MQPSRVQLEHYFVEEVSFRLRESTIAKLKGEGPKLASDDLEIEVRLGENRDDAKKRFCQVSIKLKPEAAKFFPYHFKAVLVGFFELAEQCSEEESDVLMTNTAPSILYSAAREYLLTITGRTRFLPIMLPTMWFTPKTRTTAKKGKPPIKDGAAKKKLKS